MFAFGHFEFGAERIAHDRKQPGAQLRATLKIRGMRDRLGKRFLNKVIDIARRTVEAPGEASQGGHILKQFRVRETGSIITGIGDLLS